MDTQKAIDATEAITAVAADELAKLEEELEWLEKPDEPASHGHV